MDFICIKLLKCLTVLHQFNNLDKLHILFNGESSTNNIPQSIPKMSTYFVILIPRRSFFFIEYMLYLLSLKSIIFIIGTRQKCFHRV